MRYTFTIAKRLLVLFDVFNLLRILSNQIYECRNDSIYDKESGKVLSHSLREFTTMYKREVLQIDNVVLITLQ